MPGSRIEPKVMTWIEPEAIEADALAQVRRIAALDFVRPHVAVMPDCHFGIGATVGSVIATDGAIIPAAVGVDIGCGMIALETNLSAGELPDSLEALRQAIEHAIPTGIGERGRNRHLSPSARARIDAWSSDGGTTTTTRGQPPSWNARIRRPITVSPSRCRRSLGTPIRRLCPAAGIKPTIMPRPHAWNRGSAGR